MKILLKILITIVLLFVVTGLLLPSQVHVERSIHIDAPAVTVFPYLNDLRAFNRWSPWAGRDPDASYDFSGAESGVGMRMRWYSEQPDAGSGSLVIIASVPDESVTMALDFGDMGQAQSTLAITPEDEGARVTWSFDEELSWNPIHRWTGLAMESLLGPDYAQGLANLKKLVESES
ncbi:MAG: SRPBCC family protein [Gammaproteobacteria bacterium]